MPVLVGRVLGEEGSLAIAGQRSAAVCHQVADPLFLGEGAGVGETQLLALVCTPALEPSSRPGGGVVRGDRLGPGQPCWVGPRR